MWGRSGACWKLDLRQRTSFQMRGCPRNAEIKLTEWRFSCFPFPNLVNMKIPNMREWQCSKKEHKCKDNSPLYGSIWNMSFGDTTLYVILPFSLESLSVEVTVITELSAGECSAIVTCQYHIIMSILIYVHSHTIHYIYVYFRKYFTWD